MTEKFYKTPQCTEISLCTETQFALMGSDKGGLAGEFEENEWTII